MKKTPITSADFQTTCAYGRYVAPIQLDLEYRVEAEFRRICVRAGTWLGVAVDNDRVGDGGQSGQKLDGMRTGARDVEVNGVQSWISVGAQDSLS